MAHVPRHLARPPRRHLATLAVVGALALGAVAAVAIVPTGRSGGEESRSTTTDADLGAATPATTAVRGPLGSGQAVTIAFVGDMHFEGALRARLDADPASAVGPFAAVLRSADLAVGNLETAIATGGTRADKEYAYRVPPTSIDALRAAGLDVVSMANNHGLDYGPDGLAETLSVVRSQPDRFVIGIGADEDEAYSPFTTVVQGQRIAVVAATQVLDGDLVAAWTATPDQGGLASAKRTDRLVAEVRRARSASDTVVVFLHWGVETHTCPSRDQQTLAGALVDAGADIVVGGHAHRLQAGGRLGDAVVHYGLGNFLFGAGSPEAARTGVFEVTVTGRRVDGYRWVPGRISAGVPRPLEGAEAAAELAHWEGLRGCSGLRR